ncbi:MAG: hypothetical protein JNJ57_19375 [Saprospiraceae bacterium]|nr:hypothetical protein [Saprospiraceae bacterium]
MRIKASRITNLTDARYFAAKEVQYLGFNLEEGTEHYLDPMYMKAIREWVEGPKIVGEFATASPAYAAEAAAFFGLDAVQINAEGNLNALDQLAGIETILRIDGGLEPALIRQIMSGAAAFVDVYLLDFTHVHNWEDRLFKDIETWNELFDLRPTLLQADIAIFRLSDLFQHFRLAGLSVVGGEEEQVGVKSFDELDELFEVVVEI